MGKLKPIGSEKLQGYEKIQRMIDIASYNLNKPEPINETTSLEFSKKLVDGNSYHIIKEKNGYVIKKGLNEGVAEYIEPMKNRKYYSSYSQAFKRLNLIVKELNENYGHSKNISLFGESDNEKEMKYYLELPEQDSTTQPTTQPTQQAPVAPSPQLPQTPPSTPEMETDIDVEDDVDLEIEPSSDDDEEFVNYKSIQKLVGKLAQKTREFLENKDNELDTKQIKYIVNSILSALPLDNLDEEDREEIMSKFEGGEDTDGGDMDFEETDIETEEMPIEPTDDEMSDSPEQPEGEMQENLGAVARVATPMVASYFMNRGEQDEEIEHDTFKNKGSRTMGNRLRNSEKEMQFGVSESKVDKVLNRYFKSEDNNVNRIQKLSESFVQEKISKKLMKKFPEAKLLGKNTKHQLVFEIKQERIYITEKGEIL